MSETTPKTSMPRLIGKIFITGHIKVLTGLHIGGSKADLDIGGVDLNVIKTAREVPFIPGSSLKGKLRTLLARKHGSRSVSEDGETINELFGYTADNQNRAVTPTRLIVRDSELNEEEFEKTFDREYLDSRFTEIKTENSINRKTGTAENPRQLERVPPDALFRFEIIYNEYDDDKTEDHLTQIATAMRLLEDDYLGGQGSRGYGRISFVREDIRCVRKKVNDYEKGYPEGTTHTFAL